MMQVGGPHLGTGSEEYVEFNLTRVENGWLCIHNFHRAMSEEEENSLRDQGYKGPIPRKHEMKSYVFGSAQEMMKGLQGLLDAEDLPR